MMHASQSTEAAPSTLPAGLPTMPARMCEAIDLAIGSKGSHYDVAMVAKHVLAGRMRYVGEHGKPVWEVWDDAVAAWRVMDPRPLVRIEVSRAFLERARYWHAEAESIDTDYGRKIDAQIKSQRLMEICLRVSNENFLKGVIKEARAFFVSEDL